MKHTVSSETTSDAGAPPSDPRRRGTPDHEDAASANTEEAAGRRIGPSVLRRRNAPLTVFLEDDDTRERVEKTTVAPWSGVVSITIDFGDEAPHFGSGWLIDPFTVVTAGHCLYLHPAGGMPGQAVAARSVIVAPGRNGSLDSSPYGWVKSSRFDVAPEWKMERSADADYGVIHLPRSLRWNGHPYTFPAVTLSDTDLMQVNVNIAGYPEDKNLDDHFTMWTDGRQPVHVTPTRVFYRTDSERGQSGGPLIVVRQGRFIACGVHAYGEDVSRNANSGIRLTKTVLDRIDQWRASAARDG